MLWPQTPQQSITAYCNYPRMTQQLSEGNNISQVLSKLGSENLLNTVKNNQWLYLINFLHWNLTQITLIAFINFTNLANNPIEFNNILIAIELVHKEQVEISCKLGLIKASLDLFTNLINIRNFLIKNGNQIENSIIQNKSSLLLSSKVSECDIYIMAVNLTNRYFDIKNFIKKWNSSIMSDDDRQRLSYRRMSLVKVSEQSDFGKYSYFLKNDINFDKENQHTYLYESQIKPYTNQSDILVIKSVKNICHSYQKDLMITLFAKFSKNDQKYTIWFESGSQDKIDISYRHQINSCLQLIIENEKFLKSDILKALSDNEWQEQRKLFDTNMCKVTEKMQTVMSNSVCLFFSQVNYNDFHKNCELQGLVLEIEQILEKALEIDDLYKNLYISHNWNLLKIWITSTLLSRIIKQTTSESKSIRNKLIGAIEQKLLDFINKNCQTKKSEQKKNLQNCLKKIWLFLDTNSCNDLNSQNCDKLYMLLDEYNYHFPFESLPRVTENTVCVNRIPSINFLLQKKTNNSTPNRSNTKNTNKIGKTYYVCDPGNDFQKTQTRLKPKLQSWLSWDGVIGQTPDKKVLIQKLQENYNYIFLGHGGGERILNDGELNRIKNMNNIVLLMGCASASLFSLEKINERKYFELDGTGFDFLSSDCNFQMGNLWSVTDRDVDMQTQKILDNFIRKDGSFDTSNLSKLNEFKQKCCQKSANGSALVFFSTFG